MAHIFFPGNVSIRYDHEKRRLFCPEVQVDLTFERAMEMWEDPTIPTECNRAFITLGQFDGNMEAVERYYNECENKGMGPRKLL